MFEERNLLYFDEYYFENGDPSKPKYFLVLKRDTNGVMIISLPSSKVNSAVPENKIHGCINLPAVNFGCYFFENQVPITECGFGFPFDTFVYAYWITDKTIETIDYIYKPKDYSLIGKLTTQEYNDVLACLRNSPNIKNKYRKLL
jgi:hypothetical protein